MCFWIRPRVYSLYWFTRCLYIVDSVSESNDEHSHWIKMPRTYIRKKQTSYSRSDLKVALDRIRRKELSATAASNEYRIPLSTIYAHLAGNRGENKCGGRTILSREEEEFLIHVIQRYQEWQQPLTRTQLISIARRFMIELGKKGITKHSLLRDWFYGFRNRWNDQIKLVECYKLEKKRSVSCTQMIVGKISELIFNIHFIFFYRSVVRAFG